MHKLSSVVQIDLIYLVAQVNDLFSQARCHRDMSIGTPMQCAGHIMTKHVGALNLTEQPQCRIKAVQCNTADHYAVTLNEVFAMRSKTPDHKMNPHYIELHPWWSMPVCILLYSSSIDPQCMALQLTPLHSGKLWQKSTFSKAVLEVCFLCCPPLQCTTTQCQDEFRNLSGKTQN